MVYLEGWIKVLKQHTFPQCSTVVFDHGPIYRMALLREFGPKFTASHLFKKWWNHFLEIWAKNLDLIILLDAKNELLIERIQSRSRFHSIKEKSNFEKYDFLLRYRRSYQYVITKMTSNNGPMLLRFNTSNKSPEQIADDVLPILNMRRDV